MMIFYFDNSLFTRIFGGSVINKQTEDDHFKVLCVIFEVMGCNLQNIEVDSSTRSNLAIYPPQRLTLERILIGRNLINPHIGKLPFSDLVNREVSLF